MQLISKWKWNALLWLAISEGKLAKTKMTRAQLFESGLALIKD